MKRAEDNEEKKDIISGLCPKVKADIQREVELDIQNNKIDGDSWWWCANGKQCNFPFTINGQKHYKPVEGKCIAADNNTIDKEFEDHTNLVSCSPCSGNSFLTFCNNGFMFK